MHLLMLRRPETSATKTIKKCIFVLRRPETSATNHANIVQANSLEKTHSRDLETAKRAFSLLFFTLKS